MCMCMCVCCYPGVGLGVLCWSGSGVWGRVGGMFLVYCKVQ